MKFSVSISGYGATGSESVTILCLFDEGTGVLVAGKSIGFSEIRLEGFAMVTNLQLPERDFLFTDEHLRGAIREYYARSGQGLIDVADELSRWIPDNKIELLGVDERGPKYQLSPDIGNGEVAILAAVAFVLAQEPITGALGAMEEFNELYKITSI